MEMLKGSFGCNFGWEMVLGKESQSHLGHIELKVHLRHQKVISSRWLNTRSSEERSGLELESNE